MRRALVAALVAAGVALAGASYPAADLSASCRTDDGIRTCAPSWSPTGALLVGQVEEDGSARYADGSVFDAETRWS